MSDLTATLSAEGFPAPWLRLCGLLGDAAFLDMWHSLIQCEAGR